MMTMVATQPKFRINSQRLRADFEELAQIGETEDGGVSRTALSSDDIQARQWFVSRIEEAGLMLRDDEVGNISGILPCADPQAPTLLLGSHLDSVPNGGRYDGSVGVLTALEVLRSLQEAGVRLPFHVEAINFTDEEGSWHSFFGSMGFTGTLSPNCISDTHTDNAAFRLALFRAGLRPDEVFRAQRDLSRYLGYIEVHIEQGERLERAQKDIGIVTRIAGRSTYKLVFKGEAAHVATVSPERRRDALAGAVLFLNHVYGMIASDFPQGMVNCGNVTVHPGAYNIVPSEVMVQVEIRHEVSSVLDAMERHLIRIAEECAATFRLNVSAERTIHRHGALMDDDLQAALQATCDERGIPWLALPSLAGHDAQILAPYLPSAMLFLPSIDGISHNPNEYTPWENIEIGANVILQTVLRLAHR